MQDIVLELMARARRRVGKDAELAALISPVLGRQVRPDRISAWATGGDAIQGDSLLAICQVTGVSIDELLFQDTVIKRLERLERRMDAAEGEPPDEPSGPQGG